MNKFQRYRQKLIREGKCPHCGQPCAPYAECAKRREYKRYKYDERSKDKVNFRRDVTSKKRSAPRGRVRYWTSEDDVLLREMNAQMVPAVAIAKRLNRTIAALEERLRRFKKMEGPMT